MNPLLGMLIGMIPDVLKRILPGETAEESIKRMEIQTELTKTLIEAETKQLDVNAEEARHESLFVAGWRPFVGWVCGIGLALTALSPLLNYFLLIIGAPALPHIDNEALNTILMGMLGLGSLRTVEKVNWNKASGIKK